MKKKLKKLELSKETVRTLELTHVHGGLTEVSCADMSCNPYHCPREWPRWTTLC